jgi:solute carrier family 6 (neurotransmitter transporter, taurine) member 6
LIKPNDKLLTFCFFLYFKVWAYAAIQNFNSIGVAFGGLISMSSFNKQNKPILGNVLTIALVDAITSLICGSTVFSVLGYIAKSQSKEIDDIISQGPGLVFMVLPEAIRNMNFSPVWAVLFFLMIFMLGIDSQVIKNLLIIITLYTHFY